MVEARVSAERGLLCRWPGECRARFLSDGSVQGIRDCAKMRDEHEQGAHGYFHVVIREPYRGYNLGRLSSRGRSTLSLKKTGRLT